MVMYECVGDIRGSCGHKHRTLSGAKRCLLDDRAGCSNQGGYSDRMVRGDDGSVWDTGDGEIVQVN
jgi:hypothetical protein